MPQSPRPQTSISPACAPDAAGVVEPTTLDPALIGRQIAFQDIPVVDLQNLIDGSDETAVAKRLGWAAEHVGFLYVANHGVPQDLIDRMFEMSQRFFAQPLDAKTALHIRQSTVHRGYFPTFEENTDPDLTADLKEGFDLGRHLEPDDPEVMSGLPLHGPNQWPTTPAGFRETADAYFAALTTLGHAILRGFAMSLDLPSDFFEDKINRPLAQLRLLHYPPQAGFIKSRTMGCGAHTDYGCLTILAQDPNGGLQVRNAAGDWISAPPVPGTFVINLGDQMARWTNGRFAATPHRVINTSGKERYSMPFFFDPNFETWIDPLESCVTEERPALFQRVQAGPYLMSRFDATFAYRKTPSAGA
jgi:isopenicillin N synthase-like dioxygenase